MVLRKPNPAFNPNARSPKGAVGPMQLLPGTAAEMGVVDPNDPEQNYEGGAKYYAQQLKAFGGDRAKALEAYNAGPGRVAKASKTGLPLPAETQAYVPKVEKPEVSLRCQTAPSSRRMSRCTRRNRRLRHRRCS